MLQRGGAYWRRVWTTGRRSIVGTGEGGDAGRRPGFNQLRIRFPPLFDIRGNSIPAAPELRIRKPMSTIVRHPSLLRSGLALLHSPAGLRTALGVLLCLLLAFGFLGTRGIWDPDEGRYTNVALTMLDSGDWLDLKRNEDTGHWTKPPATYWLIAGSIATFGRTPWAARLPIALSYLACICLAWLCARRLAKGTESTAAIVYATMLLPACAGQLVTTDFPLAAMQALAMYGFVEYRFGDPERRVGCLLLMWIALATAFMTKGPPALTVLLAVAALGVLAPGRPLGLRWHAFGITVFLLLALPWFVVVGARHEGLASYFVGAELVDRVASDRFHRNGEWHGWLKIYGPTLLVGTLPWTAGLWRWIRSLPSGIRGWRVPAARQRQARTLLLALWIVLPLLVFCLARSRLPLYILPLFVPIAIAIAATRHTAGQGLPRWPWLLLWVILLLGLRFVVAGYSTHKDASAWAEAILARATGPVTEVIFVEDMARYGLNLHLGAEVERVARTPGPQSRFNPTYDEPLSNEVAESGVEDGLVYVVKQSQWAEIEKAIEGYGYQARPLGVPYRDRVIFEVVPPITASSVAPGSALSTP